MKYGFTPISLDSYIEKHIAANKETDPHKVRVALITALNAYNEGVSCNCGNDIWVIASAFSGFGCFTCITGESMPSEDYELVDVMTDLNDS